MAIVTHLTARMAGSTFAQGDHSILGLFPDLVNAAGDGGIATVPVSSPGAGYTAIPTVAIAGTGALGAGASAAATAVMKVVSATIAAGGSGGTTGTQTVTGTTGTGTKFQASVTVAGGAITAILSITVAGAYTVLPTLAGEPVTGASLTGATLNLSMGVGSITVGTAGTGYPADGSTTATPSGGTPTTPAVLGTPTITSANGAPGKTHIAATLPSKFNVQITPNQQATPLIKNKASTGYDVILYPPSGAALAAGTFDAMVMA